MADTTSHQPYQFGDVVDGYRWTITGWEPVSAPPRTVGVPRLLEARYAATQQARKASRETPPQVVTDERDAPVLADDATEADEPAIDLDAVLNRRVVAAPDLVVEFHEPEVPEVDDPWPSASTEFGSIVEAEAAASLPAYDDEPAYEETQRLVPRPSSAAESQRSWYGLGWDTVDEPGTQPVAAAEPDDSDAPFAAALALGSRTLAEQHQPSDIEIAAGLATAAGRTEGRWSPAGRDQVDEWTGDDADAPPAETPLDARTLAYSATAWPILEPASMPVPEAVDVAPDLGEETAPEASLEPKPAGYTLEPPAAGWYPGSA